MNEEVKKYLEPGRKNLILIYISFLAGILIPISPMIGAAFAYANLGNEDIRWRSHYLFAFRTFFIGLVGFIVAFITTLIFIGPIIHVVVFIWSVVRVILALQLVMQDSSHPDPMTFWIK